MSTRYVFWRTPEGKPYRGTDGKHAPVELLAETGRISRVSPDGKVSWVGFAFQRLTLALKLSSVVICPQGEELNEFDAWGILKDALADVIKSLGGNQPLKTTEVLKVADSKAAAHFRKREAPYILVSSLSVESLPFSRAQIAGCRIEALSSRGKYAYPDTAKSTGIPAIAGHIKSSQYQLVRVQTSGRTALEAVDKAFRALNLLRGLLSLFATYGSWAITFGRIRQEPLGVIHTGPVHTLHHPDGELVGDFYWYERVLREDGKLFKPSGGWGEIEKQRRRAMNQLSRLRFRKDIEELIIRYATALDQTDHDVGFLQMWSILEKLTHTTGANYDETLKRTLWIFSDRPVAKDFLECVRLRRNLLVHAARSSEEPDQASYLIKTFIDPHLVHLMSNIFGVESIEEYGQHLSLPTDLNTLRRNRRWAEKAIRFLHKQTTTKAKRNLGTVDRVDGSTLDT